MIQFLEKQLMGNYTPEQKKQLIENQMKMLKPEKLPKSYINPTYGSADLKKTFGEELIKYEAIISKVDKQAQKKIEQTIDMIKKKIENCHYLDLDEIYRSLEMLKDTLPGVISIVTSMLLFTIGYYKVSVETQYKALISNELFQYLYSDISSQLTLAREDAEHNNLQTAYDRCRTILQKVLTRIQSGKLENWIDNVIKDDKSNHLSLIPSQYSEQTHVFPLKRKALKMLIPLYAICKYVGKLVVGLSKKQTASQNQEKADKVLSGLQKIIVNVRLGFLLQQGRMEQSKWFSTGRIEDTFTNGRIQFLISVAQNEKGYIYYQLYVEHRKKLTALLINQLRSNEI